MRSGGREWLMAIVRGGWRCEPRMARAKGVPSLNGEREGRAEPEWRA
jgi:hypothetical protein